MTTVPSVTAVVLTWNNCSDTLECIDSLLHLDYSNLAVLVVDNNSSDDTVTSINTQYPKVTVIENSRNLGYAEGNNVGIRSALQQDSEYVFVLNNDITLASDSLSCLVQDMSQNGNVGAASPKSYYHSPRNKIYFAGGRITSDGNPIHVGVGEDDAPQFNLSTYTDWLTGCAILFRSHVLREVGLFDPAYFLLFEDLDWSLRARKRGYKLKLVASSHLWHKVSPSFGGTWSSQYLYYYTRNNLLLIERHFPLADRARLYIHAVRRATAIARKQSEGLNQARQSSPIRAVQRGMIDYLLRRFGERLPN